MWTKHHRLSGLNKMNSKWLVFSSTSLRHQQNCQVGKCVFLLKHVSNHPVVSLTHFSSLVAGCSHDQVFFGPGSTTASGQAEPIRGEWRFFFNCLAFFQKKNGIVIVGSRCKSLVTPTTRVICRVYHIRITPPKTNILNSKIAGLSRCFEPFPFGGFLGIFSGSSR